MVQVAADAAHVRDGTSGLISKDWLAVLPRHVRELGETAIYAGIGAYYEVMGVISYVDDEPDTHEAVVGEIAVRLGVKPGEMGRFRHNFTRGESRHELLNLRALTRLGVVRNEADLLAWSLRKDGVGGDPT